jgi:5'(3')-deoxyribonucleotidase
MKKTYYFDVDGVLADFHSKYDPMNRAESLTYNFIRNLKPFAENVALVKRLVAEGNRVYISTMVANEATKKARIDWLAEMLPEIPAYRIITIVGHAKKCDKMRTKDGILIDDKLANCKQWIKAGHEAVWLEAKGGAITL